MRRGNSMGMLAAALRTDVSVRHDGLDLIPCDLALAPRRGTRRLEAVLDLAAPAQPTNTSHRQLISAAHEHADAGRMPDADQSQSASRATGRWRAWLWSLLTAPPSPQRPVPV